MEFKEKEISCIDCDCVFIVTTGEQNFLNKLLDNGKIKEVILPKRCVECRTKRKASYAEYNEKHKNND